MNLELGNSYSNGLLYAGFNQDQGINSLVFIDELISNCFRSDLCSILFIQVVLLAPQRQDIAYTIVIP